MVKEFSDRELLARLLRAEAGSEGTLGKLAVGSVIRNRAMTRGYGDSIREVMMKPGQFSPLNSVTGYAGGEQGVDFDKIAPSEEDYAIADAVLKGEAADPTGGATHFYNPDISKPAWGAERSGGNWMQLGRHVFGRADAGRDSYVPPESTAQMTDAARRRRYAMGDADPGGVGEIIAAAQRGDITDEETLQYLQGLPDKDTEKDGVSLGDFMASMEALEQVGRAPEPTVVSSGAASFPNSRTNLLSARARSARPGSQGLDRFGLESLLGGNPLLGVR